MARVTSTVVKESAEELTQRLKEATTAREKDKLQVLYWLKQEKGLFGLCYAMDGGYKGWNPYIEKHLAIFVNFFDLERTNQLNLLPDKDLVCLCHPIEP